jgi:putative ABC transport system substrate-binding protein
MKRRKFITLLGGAAVWPVVAHGQHAAKQARRIGVLNLVSSLASEEGMRRGLQDLGYVEGRDIVFATRYADGRQEQLPALAAELLGLKVELIASATTQAIQAIRRLDATIPIVMTATSDPIGSGLIASLSQPGGNTTGVTMQSSDVAGKRLELLKDTVSNLRRVAVLAHRNHPATAALITETEIAARALNIEPHFFEIEPPEIEGAFLAMTSANAEAVVIQWAAAFIPQMRRLAELAAEHRLPSITESRAFAKLGGLMSYGTNVEDLGRRAASYVDKILKGERASDLPVEQPTKFPLVINLKTATALGIAISPVLLARADEVIE